MNSPKVNACFMEMNSGQYDCESRTLPLDHRHALPLDHRHALPPDHRHALRLDHRHALPLEHRHALPLDHRRAVPIDHRRGLPLDHRHALPLDNRHQYTRVATVNRYKAVLIRSLPKGYDRKELFLVSYYPLIQSLCCISR